jgi:hypothetical protein
VPSPWLGVYPVSRINETLQLLPNGLAVPDPGPNRAFMNSDARRPQADKACGDPPPGVSLPLPAARGIGAGESPLGKVRAEWAQRP